MPLVDCTYKTNKFYMLLLHFMGMDDQNNSFTIGLSLLSSEIQSYHVKSVGQLIEVVYNSDGVTLWASGIATDCEVGLTNAIDQRFLSIHLKRSLGR